MKSKHMKRVLAFFLILFLITISYLGFYYILNGKKVVSSVYNNRLWIKRNEVVRGSIIDRNGTKLTESYKENGVSKIKYNGGKAFAHVIGYMDPVYGITGIQNLYDTELMGDQKDGLFALFEKKDSANRGYDISTTLDKGMQELAYSLMGKSRGAVIVSNPKTGEILTMVSTPAFDPNYIQKKLEDYIYR